MSQSRPKPIEALAWWLIYGGLVGLVLGVVLQRAGPALDWLTWLAGVAGGVALALGLALIVWRSRMNHKNS